MEHYELRCLCDYFLAGGAPSLAADTWARPTPLAVNGELQRDERAEVVYMEVFSPVEPVGDDAEALKKIIVVADGIPVPYVSVCGIRDSCMAPPKGRIWGSKLYSFGTPASNNPMANTTIKYARNVTVNILCGPALGVPPESPITQALRVRLWGYVYKTAEIPYVFGTMVFPAPLVSERARNRAIFVSKEPIVVTADTWLTLPGGKDQKIPKINPLIRYAQNVGATNAQQGDYELRFDRGAVLEADENMRFEFDELDALVVESLGIKTGCESFAGVNIARCGLRIDGDPHPKGSTNLTSLYPVTVGINELNYGHLAPFAPIAHPYYAVIPKLEKRLLIWNEIGVVVIRDDGVGAVAADAVQVALAGIRIEMRG